MSSDVIVAALTLLGTIVASFFGAWRLATRSNASERKAAAAQMIAHIAQDRADRLKEHADCEKRYATLSEEIQAVRREQTGEMAKVIRENAVAMSEVARASERGTAVLDRVCRHLVALPCAKDGAERVKDLTPLDGHHTPRPGVSA